MPWQSSIASPLLSYAVVASCEVSLSSAHKAKKAQSHPRSRGYGPTAPSIDASPGACRDTLCVQEGWTPRAQQAVHTQAFLARSAEYKWPSRIANTLSMDHKALRPLYGRLLTG